MEEDDGERRPGLTLMPEYMVDMPVWHGPSGDGIGNVTAQELMALGVSSALLERLRAWQDGWEHDPITGSSPREFRAGSPLTLRLAQHLQAELPGYRLFIATSDGPRPVDEWMD